MIGPLSGDEAVSVANYAKTHPTKTFIIGTAGSQDPTLQIAPKNLFRYHGDGAQWNAGIGEIAYKKLGWRKAAIIMDDYSFGWTSGGRLHRRLLRDRRQDHEAGVPAAEHDGLLVLRPAAAAARHGRRHFWVVGGTGTAASLTAYEQAYGPLDPKQHIGNLFFAFLGADKVVGPEGRRLVRRRLRHRPGPEDGAGEDLREGRRPVVPGPQRRQLRRRVRLQLLQRGVGARPGPHGVEGPARRGAAGGDAEDAQVRLRGVRQGHRQARREPPGDPGPVPAAARQERDGSVGTAVVGFVPNVDQSFGGLFKTIEPAARPHAAAVREEEPAVAGQDQGRQERRHHASGHQVARVTAAARNERRADPPLAGGRPALRRRSGRARRRSRRRARRAPRDPRPERRRQDDALQPRRGRLPALGRDDRGDGAGRHAPARARAPDARPRPDVPEDEALPRPLGRGQPLPRDRRARRRPPAGRSARKQDRVVRERARAAAERVLLGDKTDTLVRDLSHGEQRQLEVGMASAVEPKLMLLDEPASGLSFGERERLTELLLGLPDGRDADPDRARHGRRAHRRRLRDDDARRPQGRRGDAGRDPRQPDGARHLPRQPLPRGDERRRGAA